MSTTTMPVTAIVSVKPVVLSVPGRGEELHVRVSLPAQGGELPVILFSHGFGESMDGYAPLTDHWAACGFVVIQPTHLDSRRLSVAPGDPRYPAIWRHRVEDLRQVLDQVGRIEAALPGSVRLDRRRIAVAGHSWGGQTASMLLGARVLGPDGLPGQDLSDPRVTAGVLLAAPGLGGAELSPFAAENFSFMNPDFTAMASPTLVVAGDHDQSALTTRGPDWFTDPYRLSPGPTSLLTVFGAEHSLGGITGYGAAETTDESPERVTLIQQATVAYLRTALGLEASSWPSCRAALEQSTEPVGRIESRSA